MDASTRTFFVAGVQFRPAPALIAANAYLTKPDQWHPVCKLVGEPSNKYDKYAVKVIIIADEAPEAFIGYIPKPINIDVWALKDLGYKPEAKVIAYSPNSPTYEMFKIQVTFTKTT